MKKKTILAMVLATTMISSIFAGCGEEETAATMSGTELEELDTTEKDNSELDVIETENMDTEAAPTESEAPEENDNQESTQTQQKPNNSTQTTGDSTSQKSNNTTQTTGNSTPQTPAHTHVWKEHTATKEEWVPNIVTVPDYATQQVKTGNKIVCNCGAELTLDGAEEHGMAHVLAGEPSNYSLVPVYEEQRVQIGSHEEDQGHYETVSYVDYYYCDCGATK